MEELTVRYTNEENIQLEMILDVQGVEYQAVLQSFVNFLRGLGYKIPDEFDIV